MIRPGLYWVTCKEGYAERIDVSDTRERQPFRMVEADETALRCIDALPLELIQPDIDLPRIVEAKQER